MSVGTAEALAAECAMPDAFFDDMLFHYARGTEYPLEHFFA